MGQCIAYLYYAQGLIYFLFEDVDECAINNGGCEQMCNNTIGSFICNCVTGYQLDGNGFNCSGK